MRTIKYYPLTQCENLIRKYIEEGGEIVEAIPGCLGLGTTILYNNGDEHLKNFVIEEYFLNTWSSGHRVKIYNDELPKKYLKMLEAIYEEDY